MVVRRSLLVAGNQKLSQAILHWDLPAGVTCPAKSSLCHSRCYALRGRYRFPQVQERLKWCHEMSLRNDFASLMLKEIRRKGAAFVVRIHASGDFFDAAYVRKWIRIVRGSPNTRFYAYTRSLTIPSIAPALAELRCWTICVSGPRLTVRWDTPSICLPRSGSRGCRSRRMKTSRPSIWSSATTRSARAIAFLCPLYAPSRRSQARRRKSTAEIAHTAGAITLDYGTLARKHKMP